MRMGLICTCIVFCVTLLGCANTSQPTPSPASEASLEQRIALEDGIVTYDEYQAAFQRYLACTEAGGFTVERLGETNQVIDYRIPDSAKKSGVEPQCYATEFAHIDAKWQVSREDTSVQAAQFRECLKTAGIVPMDSSRDMYDQLLNAGLDPEACSGG